MVAMARSLQLLDAVQHLAQLEAFDAQVFLAAVQGEIASTGESLADLGAQLDALRGVLAEIDRFAQKGMRIRLHQSSDVLPPPLRTLLGTTIVSYERDPALLRSRVADALARVDPSGAAATTDRVMAAAERVLALRATLREGVVDVAQRIAAAWLPRAQRAARDGSQADAERDRWRRARADLEQVAARGDTLETDSFAARLERVTALPDEEPEEPPDPTATRFSLIEID